MSLLSSLKRNAFEIISTVMVCALLLVACVAPDNLFKGLDAVVLLVPMVLLCSLPLVQREGMKDLPYLYFGVAGTAFLIWGLISTIFADPAFSTMLTWVRYLFYLLLIPAVGLITSDPKRRAIVLWAFVLAGAITSAYGVYQSMHLGDSSAFRWVTDGQNRISSTFGNPNFFGEFLTMTIAANIGLFALCKRYLKIVPLGLLILQLAALLLTYTRGSWLALMFGITVALLLYNAKTLIPMIIAAVAGVALVPGVGSRVLSIFSLEGTGSFRLGLWKTAGAAILNHPIFGKGIGNFYDAYREVVTTQVEYFNGYLEYGSHNSYFQLSAETGIIGGILFLLTVLSLVWAGIYLSGRLRNDRPKALLCSAFTAGLIAYSFNALTSNSFQHPRSAVYFFVLAGILVGLGKGYWHAPEVSRKRVASKSLPPELATSYVLRAFFAIGRACKRAWNGSLLQKVLHVIGKPFVFVFSKMGGFFLRTWKSAGFRRFLYKTVPSTDVFKSSAVLRNLFGEIDQN